MPKLPRLIKRAGDQTASQDALTALKRLVDDAGRLSSPTRWGLAKASIKDLLVRCNDRLRVLLSSIPQPTDEVPRALLSAPTPMTQSSDT